MDERLYWISWYSHADGWGFPWVWCSGFTLDDNPESIFVAAISASDVEEAYKKADSFAKISRRRFCDELTVSLAKISDRFPREDWWPDPKLVWSNISEDGDSQEFWEALNLRTSKNP